MTERQLIPAGLAEMLPGPDLAAVLAGIDLSRLNGYDAVVVLQAYARQVAHYQAAMLATMVEISLRAPGDADAPVRRIRRMCAPHHDLKTRGKARVVQYGQGKFVWVTALGHTHHIRPEPPYG